ncbi:ankyrin domain repeat containing protein [Echinococcus multilocularis]|uniref:Ankyrin domain repeat containing protein n=1 Tax=Echinococcus multilocularis TaxID=6211 RepID=A0A077RD11_ECHMU|nr:ankyrin domain repeat containing protein [Echinococcus multilocularis]CDI97563.1 ankyrin domain repeat containing protein [Echinococcus multilocularis]
MQATFYGHAEIIQCPVDRGAEGDAAATKALSKAGDSSQDRGRDLHIALAKAASKGHSEVAKFLLDRGTEVNRREDCIEAPIFAAISGASFPFGNILASSWYATRFVADSAEFLGIRRLDIYLVAYVPIPYLSTICTPFWQQHCFLLLLLILLKCEERFKERSAVSQDQIPPPSHPFVWEIGNQRSSLQPVLPTEVS